MWSKERLVCGARFDTHVHHENTERSEQHINKSNTKYTHTHTHTDSCCLNVRLFHSSVHLFVCSIKCLLCHSHITMNYITRSLTPLHTKHNEQKSCTYSILTSTIYLSFVFYVCACSLQLFNTHAFRSPSMHGKECRPAHIFSRFFSLVHSQTHTQTRWLSAKLLNEINSSLKSSMLRSIAFC